MMAAIAAAKCGHNVTLLEKNEKLGKKLFITGKGRCNVTNGADMDCLLYTSPEDGTVASIDVAVGDTVEAGAVLATLN